MVDMIVAEAPAEDGGGFFLDCPRALCPTLVERLNFYKLRAKVHRRGSIRRARRDGRMGRRRARPNTASAMPIRACRRSACAACCRRILAAEAAADLGATLVEASEYEAHRITLGAPRGGLDFHYNDAFPHEADMDQLNGIDFEKGCYVGQEVVSRVEHRGTARKRVVPVAFEDFAPETGVAVKVGDIDIGVMGSSARSGRGLAMLRLDRVGDALAAGTPLMSGGMALTPVKPDWARFDWPGEAKAAE